MRKGFGLLVAVVIAIVGVQSLEGGVSLSGWLDGVVAAIEEQSGVSTSSDGPSANSAVTVEASTGLSTPDAADALDLLGDVEIASPLNAPYDREEQFGSGWKDTDGNGCNARQDVLKRDMHNATFDGCDLVVGDLADPYTGNVIDDYTGGNAIQIDHVVPLSYAIDHGAFAWTYEERVTFANDPTNLIASDGPANAGKGDSGPAEWMPSNGGYICEYASAWVQVLDTYELSVTEADWQALSDTLTTCVG